MKSTKKVSESITEVTYLVMPNDANPLGFLRGGMLMEWMDIASEITSQKHAHCVALTIGIDAVSFKSPIRIGDTVYIKSQITRAFNTSMEIYVQVWASSLPTMEMKKTNEAFFTFVAIDEEGKPKEIPAIDPSGEEEKKLFDGAMTRRNNKK